MSGAPTVAIVAGPNGAGKSTAAPTLLRDTLGVTEYVNADLVALGLAGFDPDAAGLAAGRVVLDRLRALASQRRTFAFETTLATRSFAPWLRDLAASGYHVSLLFLWLPTAEVAVARVRGRVRLGGHDVPELTIRRRYQRGLDNRFQLYMPLSSSWRLYDASGPTPGHIATGGGTMAPVATDSQLLDSLRRSHGGSA